MHTIKMNEKEIIFEYIKAKVLGLDYTSDGFKFLCVFHNEKTPSCYVTASKEVFYCFGCHASGHIVELYKHLNGSVDLKIFQERKKIAEQNKDYKIQELIKNIIELSKINLLKNGNEQYHRYFNSRHITFNTVKKSKSIGLAVNIANDLLASGWTENDLIYSNLFSKKNNKINFMLEDTILFFLENNNEFNLAGRKIDKKQYVNLSNQKKSHFIFKCLHKAKDNLFIVEGYFDALSLYQRGISAVAIMGNTISEEQIKLIYELEYSKIIMALDNDEVGYINNLKLDKIFESEMFADYLNFKDASEYLINHSNINILNRIHFINKIINKNREIFKNNLELLKTSEIICYLNILLKRFDLSLIIDKLSNTNNEVFLILREKLIIENCIKILNIKIPGKIFFTFQISNKYDAQLNSDLLKLKNLELSLKIENLINSQDTIFDIKEFIKNKKKIIEIQEKILNYE